MKTISILGSGWLGLPLAEYFVRQGYEVKASSRSVERQAEIEAVNARSFVVDIDLDTDIEEFLKADILLINITSKNIKGFKRFIKGVERSPIDKVIFVSSTSVYKNTNELVSEDGGTENLQSPLFQIENLFRNSPQFQTTIIRFAGLFDSHRHPGRFFARKPISQPDVPVNLIHRDDCINIVGGIVEQSKWNEVFNACADTHPCKREFYCHAGMMLGLSVPVMGSDTQTGFKIISNQKLKQALNYNFVHGDLMAWSGL